MDNKDNLLSLGYLGLIAISQLCGINKDILPIVVDTKEYTITGGMGIKVNRCKVLFTLVGNIPLFPDEL